MKKGSLVFAFVFVCVMGIAILLHTQTPPSSPPGMAGTLFTVPIPAGQYTIGIRGVLADGTVSLTKMVLVLPSEATFSFVLPDEATEEPIP